MLLSESSTLAPPTISSMGALGDSRACDSCSISRITTGPAWSGPKAARPTTEAWARCATEKPSSATT